MLLDYAIRSTILLGLTGAVALALRGRSASWRHMIWLAGLLALLALPAARMIAPRWNAPAVTQRLIAAAPVRTVINVYGGGSPRTSYDWPLIVWLGGAAFFLARSLRSQLLASRLASRAVNGVSEETDVPMVCGLWRPVIVLPADSAAWPEERLESVLRHERMHIARRDTIAQALAQLACALYWPQPLVWLAAAAMRNACEQACDDGVLSQGTKPSAYAGHLMEIARGLTRAGTGSRVILEGGIAMTHTNQLEERISALLNSKRDRRQAGASFAATVTALAVTVVIALAALHTPVYAQSGKLTGIIRDASGAVVPRSRIDVQTAVSVRGTNGKAETGSLHEVVYTNAIGEFSLDLPDGSYDITIATPGFATEVHQAVLFESATAKRMEATLNVGGIRESIQVRSGEPLDAESALRLKQKFEAERAAMGASQAGGSATMPQRIRVGGNVQAANLIRKVTPAYPQSAKADRVEGTVIMNAVISKEGDILSLEQVNKQVDSRLADAAMAAVRDWKYKPTLLNGQPIEVVTQIDVNFTLSN